MVLLIHIYNKNYQHMPAVMLYRNFINFFFCLLFVYIYYIVSLWNASINFSFSYLFAYLCVFLHICLPRLYIVNVWQFEKFVYTVMTQNCVLYNLISQFMHPNQINELLFECRIQYLWWWWWWWCFVSLLKTLLCLSIFLKGYLKISKKKMYCHQSNKTKRTKKK